MGRSENPGGPIKTRLADRFKRMTPRNSIIDFYQHTLAAQWLYLHPHQLPLSHFARVVSRPQCLSNPQAFGLFYQSFRSSTGPVKVDYRKLHHSALCKSDHPAVCPNIFGEFGLSSFSVFIVLQAQLVVGCGTSPVQEHRSGSRGVAFQLEKRDALRVNFSDIKHIGTCYFDLASTRGLATLLNDARNERRSV